ncbi:hypothetical protein BDW67DRAFT_185745 [Aspergillus spinulosporus]
MSSVPSTPMSFQFSTPNQTSRFSSPSNSPEETHPRIMVTEETDVFAQESPRLPDSGDDFASSIPSVLKACTDNIMQIVGQKLDEQRTNHEAIQAELQKEKDSALSDLEREQGLAARYKGELEAEITERKQLTENLKTLEKQLNEVKIERANLEGQLAEKVAQLSNAAEEYAKKEEIWNSVMGILARIENENNEIREKLERTNASIAEQRANHDRSFSELEDRFPI